MPKSTQESQNQATTSKASSHSNESQPTTSKSSEKNIKKVSEQVVEDSDDPDYEQPGNNNETNDETVLLDSEEEENSIKTNSLLPKSNILKYFKDFISEKYKKRDGSFKKSKYRNEKSNKLSQEEFDNFLVKTLIINGGFSIRIVENPGFRMFIEKFWHKSIISRKSIVKNKFPVFIKSVTDRFLTEIESVEAVSVTTDFWSDCRKRSFMGVTAHYVFGYELKRFLLKLKHVTGTHSGSNIEHWFRQIVDEYKITSKLYRVSTDNAKNMLSGFDFSIPGFESCQQNILDSENESDFDLDDPAENSDSDLSESILEFYTIMNENKMKRLACFNHTLQLTVLDGIKACRSITKALSKENNIANLSHQNKTVAELINALNLKTIPLKSATRWNGHLNLIKIVLEVSPHLIDILNTSQQLTFEERKQLSEFVEILEPFLIATQKCESEKKCYDQFSYSINTWNLQISTSYKCFLL